MRTRWIILLILIWGSAVFVSSPRIAQAQPVDMERALVERFGFSPAEIGQMRAGQSVVKTIPAEGREIAVAGAVRIPDDKERLVGWIRDVEGFRKAPRLSRHSRRARPGRPWRPTTWASGISISRSSLRAIPSRASA